MNDLLKIRDAIPSDCHKVYEWLYYSDHAKLLNQLEGAADENIPSFDDFKDGGYFDYFFNGSAPEKGQSYIITLTGEDIGHVSKTSYHLLNGIAEFDIWLKNLNHTGKGYGTKAIQMLANKLFNENCHTIFMRPSIKNIAAIKSYKKAGFVKMPLKSEKYYRPEYIEEYGSGDYGEGGDVFLVVNK